MIVYKYFPPYQYIFDSVLENSNIRFTQPDLFNDPFESLPSFSEDKKKKEESEKAKFKNNFGIEIPPDSLSRIFQQYSDLIANIQTLIGTSVVTLCLTKSEKNGLMWSHYADSHKGLVIGFDSDCSFFKPGNGRAIQGLRPVIYSKKRKSAFTGEIIKDMEKEQEKFFFTKSIDWKYEKELRICANPQFADVKDNKDGIDMYLFKFPSECVKKIIMGFRMSKENRGKVAELATRIYPIADLLQAVLSDTEFDLDILPYTA